MTHRAASLAHDTVVIGAGVSGLATACLLAERYATPLVLEARDRIGGRVHSLRDAATGDYCADLGPAWVWPDYQPTVRRWLDHLGLATFPQFSHGNSLLDNGPGQPATPLRLPDNDGSQRVVGGPQAIVDALAARLPAGTVQMGAPVLQIDADRRGVTIHIGGVQPRSVAARRVVIAVPPRLAAGLTATIGDLPRELLPALARTPTWMAPHAKVVALYDKPFWRANGLSGRFVSRVGPIVEAHDHCGPEGKPAAIFGFIGVPHVLRQAAGADLERDIRAQLRRCFADHDADPGAQHMRTLHIEDWAKDPWTSTPDDLSGPMNHPDVAPNILRDVHGHGRLVFAGAEVARQGPGLLEGALVAAEQAVMQVMQSKVDA